MLESNQVRTVIYGEVLVDLFLDTVTNEEQGSPLFQYSGVAGGAPCNVAAHLRSLGGSVSFLGSFADDQIGTALRHMLEIRGIDVSMCLTHSNTRSPLAVVMSKPDGDRQFRLYLSGSAVEQIQLDDIDYAVFDDTNWFHFGSVLLSFPNPKKVTESMLDRLEPTEVIRSYDINVRPDIWLKGKVGVSILTDIIKSVDVLKISEEDFCWIKENVEPSLVHPRDFLERGCKLVAYTKGAQGAELFARGLEVSVPAQKVVVADTTGAGDAFMAGIIRSLIERGYSRRSCLLDKLCREDLAFCGEFAAKCAAKAVSQKGAMPPIA